MTESYYAARLTLHAMGFSELRCMECERLCGVLTGADAGGGFFRCMVCDVEFRYACAHEEEEKVPPPPRIPSWISDEDWHREHTKGRTPPSWMIVKEKK